MKITFEVEEQDLKAFGQSLVKQPTMITALERVVEILTMSHAKAPRPRAKAAGERPHPKKPKPARPRGPRGTQGATT